ncbi:unnamed protein product [Scytosiphon promiscuus]
MIRPRRHVRGVDGASGTTLSKLRRLREQISQREEEVAGVVLQARQRSDRRVKAKGGTCHAENELEQALLDATILKQRSRAMEGTSSVARPSLQHNISTKRLDLLAASPPFILGLEQALVTVASVDQVSGPRPFPKQKRWRSTLKRLMKDVSESIDRSKKLPGHGKLSKAVDDELALAAASARRLSLHLNAWTTQNISSELGRIWLQAVKAEAEADPHFHHVVTEWEEACEALKSFYSAVQKASIARNAEQDAIGARIRDCQDRAGVRPKAEKAGWWKKRQKRFLAEELRHIETKIAPMARPSALAARYNLLLAKCAEAGAWATAVSAYRSSRARGTTSTSKPRNPAGGPFSSEPFVYQHLLRAAKNADPPLPHAAMLVLREMRLRGDEPAVTHYNLVVSTCARATAIGATVKTCMPLNNGDAIGCNVDCVTGSRKPIGDANGEGEADVERACNTDAGSDHSGFEMVEREAIIPTQLGDPPSEAISRAVEFADEHGTAREHGCSLSAGWKVMESRGAEATVEGWRLALDVIVHMQKRGVMPTEVTFSALVECCRRAAAAPLPLVARDGGLDNVSTPAEIYTALKEAGIPTKVCYEAGRENALKGGRRFPEYTAAYR